MNSVYVGVDDAGIIIPREDIMLKKGLCLRSDVSGSISVHPETADAEEMSFHFNLIGNDGGMKDLPFVIEEDFTIHAIELGKRTRPASLQKHFPTTIDLGRLLLADESKVDEFRCDLLREWFALFLGANFRFRVEIKSNDDYDPRCDEGDVVSSKYSAVVTLTDPSVGSETHFEAPVNGFFLEGKSEHPYIMRTR